MSSVMGDPKTVLEGSVKYRDKKKWKSRWAVVSKLSPVADCLHIQLYRDSKERCKNGPTKASLSLEDFMGMETGFTLDKESNTMALICPELVVVLAFDNRELLIQWQVKIRANLVEEQQFLVQIAHVPPKSKLPCGPARLHLQDHSFCLVSGVPPRLLGTWPLKELRRFGVIDGKFCFEGGSLCGRGEGLHVLLTNQSEELSQSMDLASKGKLMGKRKTLSRKASVLESSSRYPLHKRCHMDSKGSTGDSSCRPLLSSGSEGSTCDACSEILRPSDNCDDLIYSGSVSVKASSCRIHYRWPSCLSRWGQSSTTTASDVDSVDTVSVILSDCQGSSQSATMSKSSVHGQSLSCLCDTQGTWPFNQCTKCGRQFYGRNSFQSCKGKASPEPSASEDTNGFSPQWTMDSLVGSSIYGQSKKDSTYQLMNPPSDRASLCSHASHSSSASAASSSGSEYSVPKNFMEALYDKPKNMQHAANGHFNGTTLETRRTNGTNEPASRIPSENCMLCPCHEPINEWMSATGPTAQEKLMGRKDCACWNKLSMTVRSDMDVRVMNSRKSASANASPSSSPKKSKYNTGANTMRPSTNNDLLDSIIPCTCGRSDPYANYAIPRPGAPVMAVPSTSSALEKVVKPHMPVDPSEEYDVPKKFAELLPNCDTTAQKVPAIKSVNNGPSCSCMSSCKVVHNVEFFKMASKHSFTTHKHGTTSSTAMDALQMCACQRVMLWAGSLVPCLGPQTQALDTGWQYNGSFPIDRNKCTRNCCNSGAICTAPPKSTEVIMKNGKVKHLVRDSTIDTCMEMSQPYSARQLQRPRSNTVSYPLSRELECQSFNYANIELPSNSSEKSEKVSDDPTMANYANIEFAEALSFYENSSLVLSRLESDENKTESVSPNKPPLPPRSHLAKKVPESQESKDKCKCLQSNIRKSPKKSQLNQLNGSAYEMMCYQKDPAHGQSDEDYLMMQPLFTKENTSPLKAKPNKSESDVEVQDPIERDKPESKSEPQSALPLRPFMPYSYPISENMSSMSLEENAVEFASRKNQLINEDFLRSMRSNSLSELKKKVLMRKRSSSVDGKNNGYQGKDSGVESVPASPVCSPKPSMQRKNSLFSKLSLRSKEKSMSTNEIALPLPVSNGTSSILMNCNKNGLHRSADCLKLSEEYANSDDDLNSDNSDFVTQKELTPSTAMKRSSSVPCRAALPTVTTLSPVRANGTIDELNDLNKDSGAECNQEVVNDCQEISQRKYSLDSHERSKRVLNGVGSDCDNMYRQENLDECDTVMEMQGVLRRNHVHSDRTTALDNYRSATSSCSSSDISDYMESLSFISRSSSSSSGSTGSADYMRSEDLYSMRTIPRPPPKSNLLSINNGIPNVHQSRHSGEINGIDLSSQPSNHRNNFIDDCSSGTSSSCSYQNPKCYHARNETIDRPGTSSRGNRDSRSSTSSTSSLSTSPSVTDYSSSTSSSPPRQSQLPIKHIDNKIPVTKPDDSKNHLCSASAGAKKSA